MLFRFGKIDSLLYFPCKMVDVTLLHLFYNCRKAKLLWDQVNEYISNTALFIPSLISQSAMLGYADVSDDYLLTYSFQMHPLRFSNVFREQRKGALGTNGLINDLILTYKFYVCNSRNRGFNIEHIKATIDKTKIIKEEITKHQP